MIKSQNIAFRDPFFETIHDGQWNACVGIQGNEQNYIEGYIEAALELASAVIDKKLMASRDTLAMPILYNGRHALELSLKFAINRLHKAGVIASKHITDHDIQSHWKHLRDANVGDLAIRRLVANIEPYVVSLAKIDDDGQELRYPTNREGQQSLNDIAVVNLPLVRKSLEAMSRILKLLRHRVIDLCDERSTGSFTSRCSREDLKAIAAMIGDHKTWSDDSFIERKAAIREKFDLSSNKFSEAIDKIRGSRQLAVLIGIETPLAYLTDEKAVFAIQQWAKVNPPRRHNPDDLGTDYFDRNWEAVEESQRAARELVLAIADNLSDEEMTDIEVIFYIGRNGEFGEHYEAMLDEALASRKSAKSRLEGIDHIMAKTNLLEMVIVGAKAAGRPSLAEKLRAIRPD